MSKEQFEAFLTKMRLNPRNPLSLKDTITLRQSTLETVTCTGDYEVLPYLVLQKMMMSDSDCRSCLFQLTPVSKPNTDSDSEDENCIHLVDCLLAVLHCCDDFLRQDILLKLSACQLAIPFLLPSPIDGSIVFLLWAMRSLVKSWKSKSQGELESRIVDYDFPIISFLRIGESQTSKSNLLNNLIGGNFFFHWDCEGGSCERQFVDGLVELYMYFPSGKENNKDFYPEALAFLNLRGDALLHNKRLILLKILVF